MRNNNSRAVLRLAVRSFKASRQRNIIAVLAIALTTVLFTTLFTLGLGAIDAFQQATMRQVGTSGHAALKYLTAGQYEDISGHPLIERIGRGMVLADSIEEPALAKRHGELWYKDDVMLAMDFQLPTAGTLPVTADEIAADTTTLELLGVAPEVGAPVTLHLNVKGEEVVRSFRLSGWWQADAAFNASIFVAGEGYLAAHADELAYTYETDGAVSGALFASFDFRNTARLEEKLAQVVEESGYTRESGEAGYLQGNVNWAYLSSGGVDSFTILLAVVGLALVASTGYLIIYNIFQISVLRDIRFYGLLKTIGTTERQIRRILRLSALWLCAVGIPVGLVVGWFIGAALAPLLIENSNFAGAAVAIRPSMWIFLGAGVFALATVLCSVAKPGRMAAKVTPVEAARYTDGGTRKKPKKGTSGGKLGRMALANLGRNKKRTGLVLASLAGSLILLNTVFTISGGLDMEKYVARSVDTDFFVTHAAKLSFSYEGTETAIEEDTVTFIQSLPGFEAGGGLYFATSEQLREQGADIWTVSPLYGADERILERLEVVEGELDLALLAGGGYILQGVPRDDNGDPGQAQYAVGQTILVDRVAATEDSYLVHPGEPLQFTVLATVAFNVETHTDGMSRGGPELYLPTAAYAALVDEMALMLYSFDVAEGYEAQVEELLAAYTTEEQPMLAYRSQATAMAEFESMGGVVMLIGLILSGIIGVIGILNFVNAILTSVIARRAEFAVLESIGMTQAQLRRMLCYEGLFYALGTILLSLLGGMLFSWILGGALEGMLWFFSYHFVIWPLVACWPVLLVLAVLIPMACYGPAAKESVTLRLRAAE